MSDHFSGSSNPSPNFMWDEEDPDEPSYIVHTFTKAKLQEVERYYEAIVDRLGSEYDVAMGEESVKSPKKPGSDFERDLLEAERLLDSKQKSKLGSAGLTNKAEPDSPKSGSEASSPDAAVVTNPNFPGAKAAGSGEVGELEIYHLPIIYKAHQTGFEPTKDLVLQPDAVFAGQYYVQSELGSAAFSTAYRCVDLNSGKKSNDGEIVSTPRLCISYSYLES